MNRLEKVREKLKENGLDGLIVDNPLDLYYITGCELSLGRLFISKERADLFLDGRYFEKYKTLPELSVKLTQGYGKDSAFLKECAHFGKKIGFDSSYTSYQGYEELLELKKTLVPVKSPIKTIREIKDKKEIELLREAAELGSKGYDTLLNLIKEGVSEEELAVELELFWKKSGGEKLAFSPHVGFGANSAFPHHKASRNRLVSGNTVLMDIGVVKDHYYSDMTRVVFFKQPFAELERIYFIVKEAQELALEKCKPGVLIKEVDLAARDWIAKKGYGDFFPHSLGHGVGLEIHEYPLIKATGDDKDRPLKEGMVITIEPGIYLPGVGGVRLEDMIVITKTGFDNLTNRPLSISLPVL